MYQTLFLVEDKDPILAAADCLAAHGAKSSHVMEVAWFSRHHPLSTSAVLKLNNKYNITEHNCYFQNNLKYNNIFKY